MLDRTLSRMPALPSLTGLRSVAAIWVFFFHLQIAAYAGGKTGGALSTVFSAGASGVSLFFVLSGFVLAWSDRPGIGILTFWRRRVARIWPLHLAGVAIALIAAATFLPGIRTSDPAAIVANIFLVSSWRSDWWQVGNPVSWSLVCEAFFYLTFPILIRLLRGRSARGLVITAVVVYALAWASGYIAPAIGFGTDAFPLLRLPEFVLGIIAALLLKSGAWRGPTMIVGIGAAVAGYVLSTIGLGLPQIGCTVLGYTLLIAAVARQDFEGRFDVLASRPMVWFGERSYAFYLVHVIVLLGIAGIWPGGHPHLTAIEAVPLTIVAFLIATVIAALLHRFVEIPGRRLILGEFGRGRRASAAVAAPERARERTLHNA